MTETYDDQLRCLRDEIQHHGARPSVIDSILAKLLAHSCDWVSRDLLMLLSDEAEHDEGMFSLIHAAEYMHDEQYILSFLSVFSTITKSSPRWTLIVMMRILNSRPTQLELIAQLRNASKSVKTEVDAVCRRIVDIDPQFLAKTISVTLATR
ncbi:Imm30 family immunity protein [Agrobacterium rosae]